MDAVTRGLAFLLTLDVVEDDGNFDTRSRRVVFIIISGLQGSDHFIIWGGAEDFFSADIFFQFMLKVGFFFHTPFEATFFLTKN